MEGRQPNRQQESLTPRQKRIFAAVAAVLLLIFGAVAAWAATNPGSYGRSRNGCVTVVVPSSTGGGLIHECGDAARVLCRHAYREHTELARLTRPQCAQAGLRHP